MGESPGVVSWHSRSSQSHICQVWVYVNLDWEEGRMQRGLADGILRGRRPHHPHHLVQMLPPSHRLGEDLYEDLEWGRIEWTWR